jgi:hypothetical protein
MADEQSNDTERVSPAECANSLLKLILVFYFYVRHGSGVLDEEGNLVPATGSKTNRLVRRVIDDIDRLWEHGAKVRRDHMLVSRFLPLLVEVETKRRSNRPIAQDLDVIGRGWKAWTGNDLTAGQLKILGRETDVKMGVTEIAQYRLGRLLDDIGERQIRKIQKSKTATAPHFWGQESPLDAPVPEMAQYIAALYFFRDVLRWPTRDETVLSIDQATHRFDAVCARLRRVSVKANQLLARSSTKPNPD